MIDYQKLLSWPFARTEQQLTARDTMLYALGIGFGMDPTDRAQLRYVYEKNLTAFPTLATMLCYPGNWLRDPATGVDFIRVLNIGTKFIVHSALPSEASLVSTPRVTKIVDKGVGKGAIIEVERQVFDSARNMLLCSVITRTLCRSDGGFGSPHSDLETPPRAPDTSPQKSIEFITAPNLALLHRLSGDYNPLHADPDVAQAAGHSNPILHGFCTLGIAGRAIVEAYCDDEPTLLESMDARFTAPVVPG